jgi:hypothetical protein
VTTRFILNTSELDDANVGLDGPSPAFVLDTSALDGNGKLDGVTFTTTATGAAALGAVSASATGTVTPVVTATAEAPLGELLAEVSEIVITVDADASAELGGLTAAAEAAVTVVASASASLGEATSAATGSVTVVATAEGLLGGLVAAAEGAVSADAVGDAPLGGLDATATAEVTPQPTPTVLPAGSPYRRPRRKKVPDVAPVLQEPEPVIVNVVEAFVTPIVASVTATATGAMTFSREEDDLQVLLML